ncbi:MAG TPA: hypothetical protein VFJ24_01885, partial [Gaiellales bacterium]|nr:hypothetical protein [Gaiellales bacterium]
MRARFAMLGLALALGAIPAAGQQSLQYPQATKGTVVDTIFGHVVPDPYRAFEDLDAPATKSWVDAENTLTFGYLAGIARRDSIKDRLTALWNYPRVAIPVREAGQIWFRKNTGLQKQSVLYRAATLRAAAVPVLDPNALFPDGSIAVAQWSASPDGRLLAYTTAVGGSDLQDIHLRDLAAGRDLPEVVSHVKFTGISWTRDSKGFFYSRFRGSAEAANLQDANTHQQSWYHALGAKPEQLVFERADDSTAGVGSSVSDDGRWLFVSSSSGTSNNRLWVADLKNPSSPEVGAQFTPITVAEDADNTPLGVVGRRIYLFTNWKAPKGR